MNKLPIPDCNIGDVVVIKDVTSPYYLTPGCVLVKKDTPLWVVRTQYNKLVEIAPEMLDVSLNLRISRLEEAKRDTILRIVPGVWVAYDDHGMYFATRENGKSPAFRTKTELLAELSTSKGDTRKRKTIRRKESGYYWYTYPNTRDLSARHCYAIRCVTSENMDMLREYAVTTLTEKGDDENDI